MKTNTPVLVFGEALFDCFPGGEQVLGGAPFNVAWHLQALGDQPIFISRIGNDRLGIHFFVRLKMNGNHTAFWKRVICIDKHSPKTDVLNHAFKVFPGILVNVFHHHT